MILLPPCCTPSPEATPAERHPNFEHGLASIYSPVTLGGGTDDGAGGSASTNLILIGERTNANGSKKFREAMLAKDWDTCVQMAKDQVKEGSIGRAHV